MFNLPADLDINSLIEFVSTPSFQTLQLIVVLYGGLLWLAIIVWVTRDAISRSESLLFQVIAILMNILFPVLGILLYLIIRPGKTSLERYYEDLEHRLILESIEDSDDKTNKGKIKSIRKLPKKHK